MEIKPKTGRTHQIRVHLSHIGYPVVGDSTYGGRNRAIKSASSQTVKIALEKLFRQALHAQMLGFIHPGTDEYMEFSAPIPEDMQDVIDALEEQSFATEEYHRNMARRQGDRGTGRQGDGGDKEKN